VKLQKIKTITKTKGIKPDNLKKPELIRAIQEAEGNFDCYGSATGGHCDQTHCLWRQDCQSQMVS
jgi:hypothetical protein